MQSIKVEENLEDSNIEKQESKDAPVDTDQSSDNEDSCCTKTKSFLSKPIKSCRGQTSVKTDDQTEESCQCCQCCQVSLYILKIYVRESSPGCKLYVKLWNLQKSM